MWVTGPFEALFTSARGAYHTEEIGNLIFGDFRAFTPFPSGIVIVPCRPWEYLSAPTTRHAFIARTEEDLGAVGSTWEGHTRGGLCRTVQRDAGSLEEGRYVGWKEKI